LRARLGNLISKRQAPVNGSVTPVFATMNVSIIILDIRAWSQPRLRRRRLMLDVLRDLPVPQMATAVCVVFVGITWVGAIFIRPFFRVLVRSQQDLNTLLGNFVSIYGVFYGILMGLLAVAAYQNKAEVEHVISSEATSVAALFRSVSVYPEAVRKPLQETIRDYVEFVIEKEWPAMRRGEIARGGMPLIDRLQKQLSAYNPVTLGQYIAHQEATQQFCRSPYHCGFCWPPIPICSRRS
jgi:hypothetical protein